MLPVAHRLRRPEQFRAVFRRQVEGQRLIGTRSGGDLVVVHLVQQPVCADLSPTARVGFVVSKAVGNSVVRHRTVRRLRHLMAGHVATLPVGIDVVVRAQPAAAGASSAQLGAELDRLLARCLRQVQR